MSNNLTTLQSAGDIASCHDSDVLVRALKACASDIIKNLSRMAAILRRLDELGVNVEIEHALLPYVRMIANGSLSAECFLACSGDPKLLELTTRLSPELQKRVAANEPFKLLEEGGKSRMVGALDLSQQQLKQVFSRGGVRSEEEQRALLDRKSLNASKVGIDRVSTGISTRTLPGTPGGPTGTARRCRGCGAALLAGAECLSCNLKDGMKLANAKLKERQYKRFVGEDPDESREYDLDQGDSLPDGWQERRAGLLSIKAAGGELGFHVDWLLAYLESNDEENLSHATLSPLLEKLAAHFGYDLTEAAA